jgi:20S proteasome alpha/beta subunit
MQDGIVTEDTRYDPYAKEMMGTTIMSVKYDGGVVVCADTSTTMKRLRNLLIWHLGCGQSRR